MNSVVPCLILVLVYARAMWCGRGRFFPGCRLRFRSVRLENSVGWRRNSIRWSRLGSGTPHCGPRGLAPAMTRTTLPHSSTISVPSVLAEHQGESLCSCARVGGVKRWTPSRVRRMRRTRTPGGQSVPSVSRSWWFRCQDSQVIPQHEWLSATVRTSCVSCTTPRTDPQLMIATARAWHATTRNPQTMSSSLS